jgi:hypothetical protein
MITNFIKNFSSHTYTTLTTCRLINNCFTHRKYFCPIIKKNIKDIHKYQCKAYSILNKMEDNFDTKLKNIGTLINIIISHHLNIT